MTPSNSKRLVSICIPVMNEERNIDPLYIRLVGATENLGDKYDFEFIFSDNNSDDNTWKKLSLLEILQKLFTIMMA